MPTGLTYPVVEDPPCSFEEFVLRCARQMGVCGAQRDEDLTMAPRLPNPDYIERCRADLDMWTTKLRAAQAMSLDAAAADAERWHAEQVAEHEKTRQSDARSRGRVQAMLVRVEAWEPPTADHEALKKLMLQQLRDTHSEYEDRVKAVPRKSAEAWKTVLVDWYTDDVTRATKSLADEERRFARTTAWVTALYESLGMKPLAHDDFKTNPFRKTTGEKK